MTEKYLINSFVDLHEEICDKQQLVRKQIEENDAKEVPNLILRKFLVILNDEYCNIADRISEILNPILKQK